MAISLGDRLRQVVSGTVPRVAPDAAVGDERTVGEQDPDGARSLPSVGRAAGARLDGARVANVLAGEWVECAEGAVLVVDRYYAADRLHGHARIGAVVGILEGGLDALGVLGRAWPHPANPQRQNKTPPQDTRHIEDGDSQAPRHPQEWPIAPLLHPPNGQSTQRPRPVPLPRREPRQYTPQLCFFDLETTGLAGGAGTQAFLVGCAVLEDGGIRVRQFLLPGFEHERALLCLVGEWLTSQGTIVTFNGRSFDLPLIETRYLLHRLTFPFGDMPHLDMLHPARRLWKQRPTIAGPALDDDSCKLSVLERHLAGYHRVGDVPGFEIPSRYFRFVRDGEARPLEAVLEHNRIDLISLALVTAKAIALIDQGPGATAHPREALGLGRLYERSGAAENAEACFAQAASLAARVGREPDVHAEALRQLALCRRRAGRMADAAEAWQQLVSVPSCPSILRREAREALAIHHEHRSRDLQSARTFVLDVLAEGAGSRLRERAEYRLLRLERKMAVREQGGLMAALEE